MRAGQKTRLLMMDAEKRGMALTFDQAETLRRASVTLRRWAEQECGTSNDFASLSIERDEATGKPYRCVYPHRADKASRYPIGDRERGALRRVAAVCQAAGLHYYHQGDPRGCALYIQREPFTGHNYTNGLCCEV